MEAARLATESDVEQIRNVWQLCSSHIEGSRGADVFGRRESSVEIEALATSALADDAGVVVCGTYYDVVFGYAIAVVEPLSDGELLGSIKHLAVEPEIRESGIGEAIMDLLKAELKARGCNRIDAFALPGDRHTKNFFESFGLKARLLTVHAELA